MKKNITRSIILAVCGALIMGVGIGMVSKVGIGTVPFTSVTNALSRISGLTLGTITALSNAVLCVIGYILCKKNVGPATVLFMFISKWPVDLGYRYMVSSDSLFINIILCIISVFVIALGAALFIVSGMGANAYDSVTLGICERLHIPDKFVIVKYAMDGFMFIVALFIKGPIGIGTVVSFGLIGLFMKFCQNVLTKTLKLE